MSLENDYLKLRAVQKRAREEMWHVFSHHPNFESEYRDSCFDDLRRLVEWEPDDERTE